MLVREGIHILADENVIDFVLPWVDGSDPFWLDEFCRYEPNVGDDLRKSRFRDWGTLKYQFRAFETLMPWVRKIHFVTCGHFPQWLNLENEKLAVVAHADYLFDSNLPVFSSHPIELNFHRIKGLADKFVYFNDDFFVLKRIKSSRFFHNQLPCDVFAMNVISNSMIAHIKLNDIEVINKFYEKSHVLRLNFFKIFNLKYPLVELMKTILLLPWPKITGFYDPHLPQPYLKKTFEEVWRVIPEKLIETSQSKFRAYTDVNQYLFRYWQLCSGKFKPIRMPRSHVGWVRTVEDAHAFAKQITSGKNQMVCLCDGVEDDDVFYEAQQIILNAFEKVFPDKSSFEL